MVEGRPRLVEGMALPDEAIESRLSCYNSATYWIDIERLLKSSGCAGDLADEAEWRRRWGRWPRGCRLILR